MRASELTITEISMRIDALRYASGRTYCEIGRARDNKEPLFSDIPPFRRVAHSANYLRKIRTMGRRRCKFRGGPQYTRAWRCLRFQVVAPDAPFRRYVDN